MIYRNHREYEKPPKEQDHEILRSWLRGEAGNDILKILAVNFRRLNIRDNNSSPLGQGVLLGPLVPTAILSPT